MRWTVTLVAEVEPGQSVVHEIVSVDRDDRITAATLGLSIAEGKAVLAAIQAQLVGDQVTRHGAAARECRACGRVQSSKGPCRSTFRSVFGNIPMRVRRFHACRCRPDGPKTVPALVTRKSAIAPELRYLTAKLAALMPFRTVAAVLNEVLPLSSKAHASTVRNRTLRVGKRLQRAPDAHARPPTSREDVVVGLDGGYVRNRHPDPARTFEVVAGQIRSDGGELTAYLDANADSLPNYGRRYRAGAAISTAFAESAVNAIIAKRMIKRQQMR